MQKPLFGWFGFLKRGFTHISCCFSLSVTDDYSIPFSFCFEFFRLILWVYSKWWLDFVCNIWRVLLNCNGWVSSCYYWYYNISNCFRDLEYPRKNRKRSQNFHSMDSRLSSNTVVWSLLPSQAAQTHQTLASCLGLVWLQRKPVSWVWRLVLALKWHCLL